MAACGRPGFEVDQVEFRDRDGRVSVRGVARCKSSRCPVCAAAVAEERRERVRRVLGAARAQGMQVAFVTLTAAHTAETKLSEARQVLGEAWRMARTGAAWERIRLRCGVVGELRVWDATWGPATGWHLHIHALVLVEAGGDLAEACRSLTARWIGQLAARGWCAVEGGQDWRQVAAAEDDQAVADYAEKLAAGIDAELAADYAKTGRRPGRMSIRELGTLAAMGDQVARVRWVEACEALKGQRGLVVGPRLKALLGLGADDDGTGDEALDLPLLGALPASDWGDLCSLKRRGEAVQMIADECLTEDGGGWDIARTRIAALLEPLRRRRAEQQAEELRREILRARAARERAMYEDWRRKDRRRAGDLDRWADYCRLDGFEAWRKAFCTSSASAW